MLDCLCVICIFVTTNNGTSFEVGQTSGLFVLLQPAWVQGTAQHCCWELWHTHFLTLTKFCMENDATIYPSY